MPAQRHAVGGPVQTDVTAVGRVIPGESGRPCKRVELNEMGQVTIHLDEETQSLMKRAVRHAGVSQSRWIAQVIREKVHGEWPADVAPLAGAWPDALTAEEIRAGYVVGAKRESL